MWRPTRSTLSMVSLITLQLDAVDYRGGKTELQTALLNGGAPFFLANDGQTIRAAGILEHHFQGWLIGAGPIVSFINHRFQRSDPSILFLSSNRWTLGSLKLVSPNPRFFNCVESHLSIPLTLKQEPVTSGTLKGSLNRSVYTAPHSNRQILSNFFIGATFTRSFQF